MKAFETGFIKSAMQAGFTQLEAESLYKKAANELEQIMQSGIGGSILGGGAGAGLGYLTGHNKDKSKDHGMRNAALLGLLGAGAGGLAGAGHQYNTMNDKIVADMEAENAPLKRLGRFLTLRDAHNMQPEIDANKNATFWNVLKSVYAPHSKE